MLTFWFSLLSSGVKPIIGVFGSVSLSVKSTYFFTVPMTIEIWYVPFTKGIVYVLGEVKSVNCSTWKDGA